MSDYLEGVEIVLLEGAGERTLDEEEAKAVAAAFEEIRRDATKFGAMLGRPGRLLVIDPDLIATVTKFLKGCASGG